MAYIINLTKLGISRRAWSESYLVNVFPIQWQVYNTIMYLIFYFADVFHKNMRLFRETFRRSEKKEEKKRGHVFGVLENQALTSIYS